MQVPDAAALGAFEGMWDEEWRKHLVNAAMERVKAKTNPEHYQIFYLHSVKNMPARDIGELMGASAAKVYVVRHRVARMMKRELALLAGQEGIKSSKGLKSQGAGAAVSSGTAG